jgi:hypothetical protein
LSESDGEGLSASNTGTLKLKIPEMIRN